MSETTILMFKNPTYTQRIVEVNAAIDKMDRMARVPDYQKQRVYDWESEVWNQMDWNTQLRSTSYLTRLMDDVKNLYEEHILLTKVDFSVGDTEEMKEAVGLAHGTYLVELRPDGMYDQVLLHEMAHIILNNIAPSTRSGLKVYTDHGPIFVGILMYLLRWHYDLRDDALSLMHYLAKKHEVEHWPWVLCTPSALRRL